MRCLGLLAAVVAGCGGADTAAPQPPERAAATPEGTAVAASQVGAVEEVSDTGLVLADAGEGERRALRYAPRAAGELILTLAVEETRLGEFRAQFDGVPASVTYSVRADGEDMHVDYRASLIDAPRPVVEPDEAQRYADPVRLAAEVRDDFMARFGKRPMMLTLGPDALVGEPDEQMLAYGLANWIGGALYAAMVIPVPAEPVGVGARWRRRVRVGDEFPLEMTARWELVRFAGPRAIVKVQRQWRLLPAGKAPITRHGVELETRRWEVTLSGTLVLDPETFVSAGGEVEVVMEVDQLRTKHGSSQATVMRRVLSVRVDED